MGYAGQIAQVPIGVGGLRTDDNQNRIPIEDFLLLNNIELNRGTAEKERGSRRWNDVALTSPILSLFDWFPDDLTQRFMVVTADGTIRKYNDPETVSEITGTTTVVAGKHPHIVSGGAESANRDRKLFIFTGNNQIQVISGDGTTRRDILEPAADWGTTFPRYAILHRNRLWAFGNDSDPHRIYASDTADHENFTTNFFSSSIYPGEGERLVAAFVFKGRLFLFKTPRGVYYLDDTQPNTGEWGIRKLSDSFGIASPRSAVQALDDMLIKNATGSISSMRAVQAFGDIESGDLLANLRNENFMRQTTSRRGVEDSSSIYYEDKKRAMFTYRSQGGIKNDRILNVDVSLGVPRVTWTTKDQPNVLVLRKDSLGIERPFYGADDGYIYEMDREDRDVAGVAYRGEFQTPHYDMGFLSPDFAERNKMFQWLEVTFEPKGKWDLTVEVIIDGITKETITFPMTHGVQLDNFELDTDQMYGRTPRSVRRRLHGFGRRISFKCYNEGLRQNFVISGIKVGFKISGQQQKD